MNDLSSIVNQVCKNLSLSNICLVGLNNGADIVIDIAINYQLPIKNIILIDPPIFMEKPFIAEINEFISQLEHEDYSIFVTSLVDALFIHTDSRNKEIATAAFNNVNKKALHAYPTLCILTDEHHCTYNKICEEAPQFEVGKVIGSKCWATLEVPGQVNAMIERFLILNRYKRSSKDIFYKEYQSMKDKQPKTHAEWIALVNIKYAVLMDIKAVISL